jgi:hypothetical protein
MICTLSTRTACKSPYPHIFVTFLCHSLYVPPAALLAHLWRETPLVSMFRKSVFSDQYQMGLGAWALPFQCASMQIKGRCPAFKTAVAMWAAEHIKADACFFSSPWIELTLWPRSGYFRAFWARLSTGQRRSVQLDSKRRSFQHALRQVSRLLSVCSSWEHWTSLNSPMDGSVVVRHSPGSLWKLISAQKCANDHSWGFFWRANIRVIER